MNDEDLQKFTREFYENNPFYPKWPFGRISKKHMATIEEDNRWFQSMQSKQAVKDMEEALF